MPIYSKTGDEKELLRRPRLNRLGIIRLGYVETREREDGSEYSFPRASDHFLLHDAEEVAKVYGDTPTVLEPLIIPLEDEDAVASHYYRMYGRKWGLLCIGDNRVAHRRVDADRLKKDGDLAPAGGDTTKPVWHDIACPCPFLESGECKESLYLRFLLPKVPGLGVWQLRTTSYNSIQELQNCMSLLRAVAGGVTGIELKLSLVPMEINSVGRGGQVTVHILKLEVAGGVTIPQLAAMGRSRTGVAALPAPGMMVDAQYDDEEHYDPELGQWTSKKDLDQAQSEAPEAPPAPAAASAQPPVAGPAKAKQTRGQGRPRQSPPPAAEPMDELKSDRQALSALVTEVVPNEHLNNVSVDLNTWFGKNRITQLTLEEMKRAGPLFREKYSPPPTETEAQPA